jgi:hypothetical protein
LLTAVAFDRIDKYKNKLWKCQCECGNIYVAKTTILNSGKVKSCKCNMYKKGSGVYNYSGYEDITGKKWNSIKQSASTRDLEFSISKEFIWELFLKQNRKCFFTGIEISYKEGTASIDRILNSKGYTEDNVALVHKDINLMRNKFDIDYFIKLCKLVSDNNRN